MGGCVRGLVVVRGREEGEGEGEGGRAGARRMRGEERGGRRR